MDYVSVERLSESAVDYENLPALMTLTKINKYAVSNTLSAEKLSSLGRVAGKGGIITPRMYFVMRGILDAQRRQIFRRMARSSLLRMSLRVAGQGLRGDLPRRGEYYSGLDFDEEETIEQSIEKYPLEVPPLRNQDIIGLERRPRQKNGVLILDTSGSMMGVKNSTAALAAAILAYAMRRDNYSVIIFNTKAIRIKGFKEDIKIQEIVDKILDLEAVGYTNISDALRVTSQELRPLKTHFKWALLLTDGAYNQGGDPRPLCRAITKLHVINLPGKKWGQKVCRDLARIGGGKYVAVSTYQEVPRALMKILRSPW